MIEDECMFDLKKLMAALAIAVTTLTIAPAALADDDDDDRPRVYQKHQVKYISQQRAVQIAKQRVKNSHVKRVKLDRDDGVANYKVELRTRSGVEYDVKINARTGKVIYVDRDD